MRPRTPQRARCIGGEVASRASLEDRSRMRCATLFAVIGLLIGCTAVPPDAGTVPPPELVSGAGFFGDPIAAVPDTSSEILDIDPAMREFVQQQVGNARTDSAKLQRLVRGTQRAGLLALGYDGDATLTASQVFHQRRGNCLAATNLFVALARHAGLRVAFQEVEIPPAWIAESGFVMLDQHVNA